MGSFCSSPAITHVTSPLHSNETNGAWPGKTAKGAFAPGIRTQETCPAKSVVPGEIISSSITPVTMASLQLLKNLLPLLNCLINSTHIQERLFGQMVEFAVKNHIEPPNCLLNGNHGTLDTGKLLGNREWL